MFVVVMDEFADEVGQDCPWTMILADETVTYSETRVQE